MSGAMGALLFGLRQGSSSQRVCGSQTLVLSECVAPTMWSGSARFSRHVRAAIGYPRMGMLLGLLTLPRYW